MSSVKLVNLKEDIKQLERLYLKKIISSSTASAATSSSSNESSNDSKESPSCSSSNSCSEPARQFFRIISASIDEIVCELIDLNNKKYRIIANICVIKI